jgi:hypothetical protein
MLAGVCLVGDLGRVLGVLGSEFLGDDGYVQRHVAFLFTEAALRSGGLECQLQLWVPRPRFGIVRTGLMEEVLRWRSRGWDGPG